MAYVGTTVDYEPRCGTVRSLIVDGANVDVAFAGQGVKVGLSILTESEPRPVGETVFFFVSGDDSAAHELADQRAMEAAFPDFEVSPHDIRVYGVPSEDVFEEAGNVVADLEQGENDSLEFGIDSDNDDDDDMRPLVVLKTDSGTVWLLAVTGQI